MGLVRWPFPIAPQLDFCTFLSDRKQARVDVAELLRHLSRRDTSSIHLFWAWFGAGKTRTLFYLTNQASILSQQKDANFLHTVYSEFPKASKGFIDLYRTFIGGLDFDVIVESYLEICTAPNADEFLKRWNSGSADLASALKVLVTRRAADQVTAMKWIGAENIPVAQCRSMSRILSY
jgi:hypothetical protein